MTDSLNPSQPWKQKWGDDFFSGRGFVQVPCALLEFAPALRLRAKHIAVLAAILYWKYDARDPYPSIHHIAAAAGTSTRTVQRVLRDLEARKLLIIHRAVNDGNARQTSNSFDLRPLRGAINRLRRLALPPWAPNRFSAQEKLLDPDEPES